MSRQVDMTSAAWHPRVIYISVEYVCRALPQSIRFVRLVFWDESRQRLRRFSWEY
jgi:hypothetical protein